MKILSVENLSRSFGGIKANDNISFEVEEGTILGVIGPNGAGKSTLFDLITGYTKADNGKVQFFDKNIFGLSPDKISNLGIGRTFQKLKPFADQTLLENVMIGSFVKENNIQTLQELSEKAGFGLYEYIKKYKLDKKYNIKSGKLRAINQYTLDGIFIKQWESGKFIKEELGLSTGDISSCCSGKQKTAHKYIWKYADQDNSFKLDVK